MEIGDRVRFLNAVGGGIVKRFKNKDIVWVEEEDGFETPVLIKECIVVDSDGKQIKNITATESHNPQPAQEAKPTANPKNSEDYEYSEVAGGDRLNIYLAFLPLDIKQLGKCNYETYLVNNSNYFLSFNLMNRSNNAWTSRFTDVIEPNTRLFIEEFGREQINELEKICIQFFAFKKDKPYSLKNAYSVELRIDGVKFYKLHCFCENEFFDEDALIYPIVINDAACREMLISASDLQEAMTQKAKYDLPHKKAPAKADKTPQIIEVDLHINQLLDTTKGMGNTEIINYQLDVFRKTMEENRGKKGQKIVFIHGKGEGVLKSALLDELKRKYRNCPVQDASFREYGFGATMVTVR